MSIMNSHGESEDLQSVHVLFFPFMASGHMPPLVDLAKLLASRGVRATLLTTPGNAPADLPPSIHLHLIPFPSAAVGLPVGVENIAHLPLHQHPNFFAGISMLRDDFRVALADIRPDAVVIDWLLPFAAPVADEFRIPRFSFHGFSNIALCGQVSYFCQPPPPLSSGAEEELPFFVPNLPRRMEMLRSQMEDLTAIPYEAAKLLEEIREWEMRSYGVVVNSFYELETEFADHVRQVIGRRTWHVGPVAAYDPKPAEEAHESCLEWLDESEEPVLYVCFGSMGSFTEAQLRELALALKACGHSFIWAIRGAAAADVEQWWPDGNSERRGAEKRYFILNGWAPQTAILNHPAVDGFVTHCGWNSCLEAISAAVPMATWPFFAEQFFNEKLIAEVLEIGVPVGATHCSVIPEKRPLIAAAQIEKALRRLMDDGEEAKSLRAKVRELALMAKMATEEGGSSYNDVDKLIRELRDLKENGIEQHY